MLQRNRDWRAPVGCCQGYTLQPTPYTLLKVPRGRLFLMSEVPMYIGWQRYQWGAPTGLERIGPRRREGLLAACSLASVVGAIIGVFTHPLLTLSQLSNSRTYAKPAVICQVTSLPALPAASSDGSGPDWAVAKRGGRKDYGSPRPF